MAPSPRVPRVPRVPRSAGPAPAGPTHDGAAPPPAGKASSGEASVGKVTARGAKVTLLAPSGGEQHESPAWGATGPAAATGAPSSDAETTRAAGPETRERVEGRGRFGFPRRSAGRAERTAEARSAEPGEADVLAFPQSPGRRRRRRVLIGLGVAVALVAALFAVLLFTPLVSARTITVQGTHLLQPRQVESALEPVRGKPLALVGTDQVERLLSQFVQVKSARARAVPPSTLVVEIVERVPVALVKQGGKLLVVDGDGVVLGDAADASQYAVPVIDGSAMPMGQAVFRSVTAVLAALPADILAQLATASAQSPDSVELKLSDGRTVVWGNADDRELKAKVLEALMKATPEKGQSRPSVFDVSTPRHPVTR